MRTLIFGLKYFSFSVFCLIEKNQTKGLRQKYKHNIKKNFSLALQTNLEIFKSNTTKPTYTFSFCLKNKNVYGIE